VALLVAALDVREAIGFSSFLVLAYYAVTNATALTLAREECRWQGTIAALGLIGCLTLAISLPDDAPPPSIHPNYLELRRRQLGDPSV
jgi:APA family basic amino acid/polyamine antiporter